MPELPEVHTTVTGLKKAIQGLLFKDIWSDMWSNSPLAKNTIKSKAYFPYFSKKALKSKVLDVRRRAKYILIDLENDFSIIIHMKMTGHLIYGEYVKNEAYNGKEWSWKPTQNNTKGLFDPYNRHIHVVFSLSNGKHLVFCDSRKFGTITVEETSTLETKKFAHLGPEPLTPSFTIKKLTDRLLLSPKRSIKTVLMDQSILSGIGNIYSDEILYTSNILPQRTPLSLTKKEIEHIHVSMKKLLKKGIDFGGDSMSDYRNIHGERGHFQEKHQVYLRTTLPCVRKNCKGTITKQKINGRSAHYCNVCQK